MYPESSDTLNVNVTDLKYAVTEETLRAVFDSVASVVQVRMLPQKDNSSVSALVQFHDARSAEAARRERNGRCIYSECNRMEISFGNKHQMQQSPMFTQPQGNFQQQQMPQQMNPMNVGQQFAGQPQQMIQNFQQPQLHPYAMNQQLQPPQQQFQHPYTNPNGFEQQNQMSVPMNGRGYPYVPRGGRAGAIGNFPPNNYQQNFQMGQQPHWGRGSPPYRGRGFGQDQGQGYPRGGRGVGPRGRGGFDPSFAGQQQAGYDQVNPFVSIAMLAEDIPLLSLFTLLEVWGNIVYIKRNFNKPEVITARFSDYSDAVNCAQNLKRVPIGDGDCEISGKIFGHFNEKSGFTEPNDEGDPSNAECKSFNFSSWKHRMGAHRIRSGISDTLKLFNVPAEIGAMAVQSSFQSLGVMPQEVTYDENAYIVTFADNRSAVKALIRGHNQVCGEQKSVMVFCPSTKPQELPATAAYAAANDFAATN